MQRIRAFLLGVIFSVFWVGALIAPSQVLATVACTGSVSPQTVEAGLETTFTYTFNNTGDETINWVQVSRPSSNFQLINYGVSGWTVGCTDEYCDVWGGTVNPGSTFEFTFGVRTGENEAASADWWLGASSGGSLVQCTGGPFGTAIEGIADTTGPVVSEPVVSGIGSSVMTIGWTSNEASDSWVEYGLVYNDYDGQVHETEVVTSHSVQLTGLSANTTYYYQYQSLDASGNSSGWQGAYSFTTSLPGLTSAPTATPVPTPTPTGTSGTTTNTPTATPTPTTTAGPDTSAPSVTVTTDLGVPFSEAPVIKGWASDNVGVTGVAYSMDGGKTFATVDELTAPGAETSKWQFRPRVNEDGSYAVVIRASDAAGNAKALTAGTLVLDTSGPVVKILTDLAEPVGAAGEITGMATDSARIMKVVYSTDGGENWLPVTVNPHPETTEAVFSFTPVVSADGNYPIVVKAIDELGNEGKSEASVLILDRMPPTFGGSVLVAGAQVLTPRTEGYWVSGVGVNHTLAVGMAGGVTEMRLRLGEQAYPMRFVEGVEVWVGEFVMDTPGVFAMELDALDGAGNRLERELAPLVVVEPGKVTLAGEPVAGAELTVYYFEPNTQEFVVWDGGVYGQENPIMSADDGSYRLVLPPGKYYVRGEAAGAREWVSRIETIEEVRPFNSSVELQRSWGGRWFGWLGWWQRPTGGEMETVVPEGVEEMSPVGQEWPQVVLLSESGQVSSAELSGKDVWVTITAPWVPDTAGMLESWDQESRDAGIPWVVVMNQASVGGVKTMVRQAGGELRWAVDETAALMDKLGVSGVPVVMRLKKGEVQDVRYGVW